ncbi:MAG: AAA-like domain-containing protein, partial [Lachnospiraceae bacterium]|nr:AAA-like domain-containing protein [Lachnospiraceae bacterium]
MRRFNVTGICVPNESYMVDISGKIAQIRELVDTRRYFTINRARQYGKTTTLACLEKALKDDYCVASISFEGIDDDRFVSPESFCPVFLRRVSRALKFAGVAEEYADAWQNKDVVDFEALSGHITKMCQNEQVVLMIDEVDASCNNRLFLRFLGTLRNKFLERQKGKDYTFHSVILAGVHDVKNIKLKMIKEGSYTLSEGENKLYNSPWNIAVSFEVDMSFTPAEIATMLADYEKDHHTGMDINAIAAEIYEYTSGYPFLVSRICQCVDEKLKKDWTIVGIREAVSVILMEKNTLFDDIGKNLQNNQDLYDFLYNILIKGGEANFITENALIDFAAMYGFIKNVDGKVAIANRIFEIRMSNFFISVESLANQDKQVVGVLQRDVVRNGVFDMELCLRKFAEHYAEIFNASDAPFFEKQGRLLFLMYLRPLINGQGFYHIESQFTDLRRMDLVVDFALDQFIIELKLWRGEARHEEAYAQLADYLASKNTETGYLLTFDFRKQAHKQTRAEWVDFAGKRI